MSFKKNGPGCCDCQCESGPAGECFRLVLANTQPYGEWVVSEDSLAELKTNGAQQVDIIKQCPGQPDVVQNVPLTPGSVWSDYGIPHEDGCTFLIRVSYGGECVETTECENCPPCGYGQPTRLEGLQWEVSGVPDSFDWFEEGTCGDQVQGGFPDFDFYTYRADWSATGWSAFNHTGFTAAAGQNGQCCFNPVEISLGTVTLARTLHLFKNFSPFRTTNCTLTANVVASVGMFQQGEQINSPPCGQKLFVGLVGTENFPYLSPTWTASNQADCDALENDSSFLFGGTIEKTTFGDVPASEQRSRGSLGSPRTSPHFWDIPECSTPLTEAFHPQTSFAPNDPPDGGHTTPDPPVGLVEIEKVFV